MRLEPADAARTRDWVRETFRARRAAFVGTFALFGLAAAAGLVGPQLIGAIVDEVAAPERSVARVDLLAGGVVLALIATAALRRAARWRVGVLGEAVLADSRDRLVRDALAMPLGTVEAIGTGELLSRTTTDLERVDFATRHAVPEILVATVTVVLTVVAMLVTSPLLTLALLVALPVIVPPTRWFWRRVPAVMRGMLDRWATLQARTHETVEGARTLDALGRLDRRRAQDDDHLVAAVDAERDLRHVHVRWVPWLELSHTLPLAAMLAIGGWAYAEGLVGLGTLATMMIYTQALAGPLDEALWWSEDLLVSATALRRVLGVPTADPREGADLPGRGPDGGARIEVREAWFGYVADRPVVRGVDLTVSPGERLAIVGPSGAGKSSLARLLAGIAVPTAGSVRLDDREVTALPEDVRRSQVLLLTQEHHVFTGTLRENLTLPAHPHGGTWDDGDLHAALDTVGLAGWCARLPGGLDGALGAGAHAVPAAVAQQLALARVVLADPRAVVLDEATSLLDTSSARGAERALTRVLAGRTVIAIAHRLHTAAAADRVAVMDDGRIVELGPPDDLLATDGPYARLVRAAQLTRRGGAPGTR